MADATTAFEVIRSVTRTILESKDVQPALDAVVRLISEKMGVDVCSIYLHDAPNDALQLAASHGLNRTALSGVSLKPDEGLTGWVFSHGEIVNIADPRSDARFKFFPALGEDRLNNFLGIPIPPGHVRGRGVLILQGTDPQPFGPTVEDLAYTLAAQLGTLMENRTPRGGAESEARANPAGPKEAPPFVRAQVSFGGVADGTVLVLKTAQAWDTLYFSESEDPEAEMRALEIALTRAEEETRWLRQRAGEIFAEVDARIFETHAHFLADEEYVGRIKNHVRERKTAAFAVKVATRELTGIFQESGIQMLATRAADLRDVSLRLLNALGDADNPLAALGSEGDSEQGVIVAAMELLPSDLVYLQSRKLLGILCETGGSTSHAAILARSLDIPCFMGIPGLTRFLPSGTRVILDGNSGLVYIRPDGHVVREYQRLLGAFQARRAKTVANAGRTLDGRNVEISGNVSLLSDLQLMRRFGIDSVGLYRSEFFFMIRNAFPDEEDQFSVYRQVMEHCGKFGVTFRLLDVGGDKPLKYFDWGKEENPSLGWRSVRMLLQRPEILQPHLRALLRAAQIGNMRLVLPMISTLQELREVKRHLREAADALESETPGLKLRLPPVGIMIEIPSTILQIDAFLAETEFLCLGTNDLIQYLFAIDRGNERVVSYHHHYHPALLQALKRVADAAAYAGKPVTVCGEMAGDPLALPLLLGLGLTSLSVAPGAAEGVREKVSQLRTQDCRDLVGRLLQLSTEDEVKAEMEAFMLDSVGDPDAALAAV